MFLLQTVGTLRASMNIIFGSSVASQLSKNFGGKNFLSNSENRISVFEEPEPYFYQKTSVITELTEFR
jgi:hypothetical protein